MKKTITIILFSLVYTNIYCQSGTQNGDFSQFAIQTPKSPEAAAMERYNFYPVNLSVGLPDVTIPIYTIKTNKLEYPITLSYHMGGIKVDDIATWVGLGWTLNAAGSINRSMKGRPDENGILNYKGNLTNWNSFEGGIVKVSTPFIEYGFEKIKDIGEEEYSNLYGTLSNNGNLTDHASDLYTYRANNISGSFMYCIDVNKEMIQIPNTDNKIIRNSNNTFTIIGDDGTIYKFEDSETGFTYNVTENHITSWLLTEIISADGTDKISFTYESAEGFWDYSESATYFAGSDFHPTYPIPSLLYMEKRGEYS